jgi:hypothetical protein
MSWGISKQILPILAVMSAVSVGSSCALDPVHDANVKALGGEEDGIPAGEFHRPGQPCLVCHGAQGPADQKFLIAGTVMYGPVKNQPVPFAEVRIRDATKAVQCFPTNCRGNFFVTPDRYSQGLLFPLQVSIKKNDIQRVMNSYIGREGSCGFCHKSPPFFDSPGQVSLYGNEDQVMNVEKPDCPPGPDTPPPPSGLCPENVQ